MKVYQTGNHIIPKLISVFMTPLWAVPLSQGIKNDSTALLCIGVLLLGVTIWTFMGRSERYVDTTERKVVTRKSWLWFKWKSESSLVGYKCVAVTDSHTITGSGGGPSSLYWNVNLVGRHSSTNKHGGFDHNLNLQSFDSSISTKEIVMKFAQDIAKELKMDVLVEAKFE